MKKSFIFLVVMLLLSSCTCLLSQIPPQYIYVNTDCQAILPNYVPQVTVVDNCGTTTIAQTPAPGYVLDAANASVEVTIRATDPFNNYSEVKFMVTAIDTIPPTFTSFGNLLTDNWVKINSLYDSADRLVAEQERYFDENFDWEASGIPEDKRPTNQYNSKMLSILVSPGHATTGYGSRMFTFWSNNDSYIVK